MKQAATRQLFAYWNALRGERAAPERSEIDPAAIRNILADTFMLDVELEKRFPFRLAGTRVNALLDSEQKGRSFLDLWREEERRNIAAILLTVADGACPVVAGGAATAGGYDECSVELLFLPLRHHGRTHSRILGMIQLTSKPSWIGLLPLGPISLRALRIIDAEESQTVQPVEPILIDTPNDLDAVVFADETRPATKPYLRLIQGGLSTEIR